MAYLSKAAFLAVRQAECFDIILPEKPDEPGERKVKARRLNTLEQAALWKADEQSANNPILRTALIAMFCLVDPEDPTKRWFNPETDFEEVAALDPEDLAIIAAKYIEVAQDRSVDEVKKEAKKSDVTAEEGSSSDSVAN